MSVLTTKTVNEVKTVSIIFQMISLNQWREDHPLQRKAQQWVNGYRDGFISTVVKNEDFDSIKLCIEDGETYIVDGKQRLSTIKMFRNNLFRLGNDIEMPIVEYMDSTGEVKEFDLRKKKFSDFPPELQLQFDSCQVMTVKHLSCTPDETAYHIRRYNHGKAMSVPQIGVTYTERFAKEIKNISGENRFFLDCGNFSKTEVKNGTLDKIVMETVMTVFHVNDWKKQPNEMGSYINENSSVNEFDTLNEYFTRLISFTEGRYENIFNSKNTAIFVAAFDRFVKFGLEDKRFADFLNAFEDGLHSKEIDGVSYDSLDENRATKDKSVIIGKIDFLEKLMIEFFCIADDEVEVKSDEEFIADALDVDVEVIHEDMNFYNESLDDLLTSCVRDDSKLLTKENRLSLLAMMVYSFVNDIDLDEWLKEYANKNNTYIKNPKKNFDLMVRSLNTFCAAK